MGKTIWLMNHYASHMLFDKGGRHYFISKYLNSAGFNAVVFCANIKNYSTEDRYIDSENIWEEKLAEEIQTPFIFVKARKYKGNGKQRILNMIDFYANVQKAAVEYAEKNGKPDVILASSVHPLTLLAGLKLAKRFGVKCISEIRDLWPESIVAYSTRWTRDHPLMKLLYAGEKRIYKKSDYVVMTWPGGYDYIVERGWQTDIPESKVIHISNGVDLDQFNANVRDHPFEDEAFHDPDHKVFVYTGSVRKVNNLGVLVEAARILRERGVDQARIVVFGDGDELEALAAKAEQWNLENIVFKGRVAKQFVPSILSQSYVSILHNSSTALDRFGQSQNKFFEYLAAGRPILMTYSVGHSVIKKYGCGIELDQQTPEAIAQAIEAFCAVDQSRYAQYCQNAAECAKRFDYQDLTNQLIQVINKCTK